jgi:hypothetical protein
MKKVKGILKNFSFHFTLALIFFLSNGYKDYIGLVPVSDMFLYFLVTGVAACILFICFFYIFHSKIKAGILTSAILLLYLFYGVIQDAFKNAGPLYVVAKYRYLLPLIIILMAVLFIYLRRTKKDLRQVTFYINCLLLVYILFDGIVVAGLFLASEKTIADKPVSTISFRPVLPGQAKPDIFFIVLDEYCGSRMLGEYFHYDNSRFETFLRQKGFFVASEPSSNYSSTPLSMAATFSMDYLKWMGGAAGPGVKDYSTAANKISGSASLSFLRQTGYTIINYSIFDILKQPSGFKRGLLPLNFKLITAKTFFGRVERDLLWPSEIRERKGLEWLGLNEWNTMKKWNENILELTRKKLDETTGSPRFIYAHLLMPHAPFLYDSLGKENDMHISSNSPKGNDKDNKYLQYLVYTNSVISRLTGDIMKSGKGQAVIIIMSDHGYRDYQGNPSVKDLNNNFNAVFLPGRDYHDFSDSISNVNQFRALFNALFDQKLGMLKGYPVF